MEDAISRPPNVPSSSYSADSSVDDDSTDTLGALLSQVEGCKNRGNIEFQKGKALAKHTAGKNLLSDACILYAEGIHALTKADACLSRLQSQQLSGESSSSDLNRASTHSIEDETTDNGVLLDETMDNGVLHTLLASLSKRADMVRPSLYLNLAACNLILHEWVAAMSCCTYVIERCGKGIENAVAESKVPVQKEPSSGSRHSQAGLEFQTCRHREIAAKALYRRSAANLGSGDTLAAKEDLVRALRLKPGDALISRELKKVVKMLTDANAKERLRRDTEEGKKRRQLQQQQQQPQNTSSVNISAGISCLTNGLDAISISPRADEGRTTPEQADTATPSTAPQDGSSMIDNACIDVGHGMCKRMSTEIKECEERNRGRPCVGAAGEKDDEPFPTWNGGECRDGLYAWNQSVSEVQVSVDVPDWAHAKDIRVDIRRLRLSVTLLTERGKMSTFSNSDDAGGETEGPAGVASRSALGHEDRNGVIIAGALSRPVQVDECLWTMERPGRVHLYLQKELPADGEPGFEWWATVMDGDEEVDVLTCDAGSDASKYPEHARRRGAKALWEDQRKTPQERRKEERMRDARRQMEEEAEERQRDLENALKDPKKAELYAKLRKAMPDTPIGIK